MKTSTLLTATILSVLVLSSGPSTTTLRADRDEERTILEFRTMVGVPRPFTGAENSIRNIPGGGLPWVIGEARGELRADGELEIRVRGLVLDPNDQAVIDGGLAGVNPAASFKAIVSCLTVDENGAPMVVNQETGLFPANAAGNARIRAQIALPNPCIAPIIFVTSPGGAWFASTGF